jgi:hypothetical protein
MTVTTEGMAGTRTIFAIAPRRMELKVTAVRVKAGPEVTKAWATALPENPIIEVPLIDEEVRQVNVTRLLLKITPQSLAGFGRERNLAKHTLKKTKMISIMHASKSIGLLLPRGGETCLRETITSTRGAPCLAQVGPLMSWNFQIPNPAAPARLSGTTSL